MLKNLFKVAYRFLMRNTLYSTISVIGLSLGIGCCMMIMLYVQEEISFDNFHGNQDNLYRVIRYEDFEELADGSSSTSTQLRSALLSSIPEVERVTRVVAAKRIVSHNNISFPQLVTMVDEDFFSMFSFKIISGSVEKNFRDPSSIVVTREMAEKYFADGNPVGRNLSILLGDSIYDFQIAALAESAPANSSLQYDILLPFDNLKYAVDPDIMESFDFIVLSTFVQFRPGADIPAVEAKLSGHVQGILAENGSGYEVFYKFQPIRDIHLNPEFGGEWIDSANPVYLYILAAIAVTILLIACINFVTLMLGSAGKRAREVGIRKIMGSRRSQIIMQFWGETALLCFISLIVGFLLIEVFLPIFNDLTGRQLSIDLFSNGTVILMIAGLVIITSLLAGIYPALVFSRHVPVETIRGNFKLGGKNALTKSLLIIQFTVSILLIIATLTMSRQIDYFNNAELGYDKNFVITFPSHTDGRQAEDILKRFRTELHNNRDVVNIAGYSYGFGESWLYIRYDSENQANILIGEDICGPGYTENATDIKHYFYINWVDPNFIPTLGVRVVEGRNFSEARTADVNGAVLINQTAARAWGMENPVGQKLPQGFRDAVIIGVVEDFNYYPLHRKVEPLVLHQPRFDFMGNINEIAVRITGNNIAKTISTLKNSWQTVTGGLPFEYKFLDEKIAAQYHDELKWRKIVLTSSVLLLLITGLGLFGLTSLALVNRTKEVAIRKVLGASIFSILKTLSKELMVLVIVSNLIAWPFAYYMMSKWLERFAHHVGIGPIVFLVTGLVTIIIALISISYHTLKASSANPIDAIKCE